MPPLAQLPMNPRVGPSHILRDELLEEVPEESGDPAIDEAIHQSKHTVQEEQREDRDACSDPTITGGPSEVQ